MISPIMEP